MGKIIESDFSRRSFLKGAGIAFAGAAAGACASGMGGCAPGIGDAVEAVTMHAGEYSTTVPGRVGDITVNVTVSEQRIEAVTLSAHEETPAISGSAVRLIPQAIVDGQTLAVDTISGATLTSGAIVRGVSECLAMAGADVAAFEAAGPAPSSRSLAAGTYRATAHGHHSDVEVEVRLAPDAIESVSVLATGETYNLSDAATAAVPVAIVEHQTTGVDTVTGATFTSCAIRTAVEDCLEQAGGIEAVRGYGARVASESWSGEEHTVDADVVVVGSGMAGIAAALSAQENGAKVAIVEKLPFWGGVSQTVRGYFAIATDDSEPAIKDFCDYGMNAECGVMKGLVQFDNYPADDMMRTLAENSWAATKWLSDQGPVMEWSTEPYVYEAQPEYYRMDAHFSDAEVSEPDVVGTAFQILIDKFKANGGEIYLNAPMTEILTDESGAVTGIKADGPAGKLTFNAAKGVILCAGGFGASRAMTERYAPAYVGEDNVTLSGNTGDGIYLAEQIGAAVYDDAIYCGQNGHTLVDDHAMIHPYQDHLTPMAAIYVNNQGLRVNGEDPIKYSPGSCYVYPNERDYYWAIVNEDVASRESKIKVLNEDLSSDTRYIDIVKQQIEAGNPRFFAGDSLADLAHQIGVTPNVLRYTVNRYNGFCERGVDEDFAKKESYLIAMNEGPWYAVKCMMKYFCTIGGVVTNTSGAVLNEAGEPIKGLYAAGENSNHGFFNLFYTGARSMTVCLVMGKIAGEAAARS